MEASKPIGLGKSRIEALSDGVFSIAMTLLVLELKLPDLPAGAPEHALRQALIALAPKFLVWVTSFLMAGIFWVGHHNQFHFIHRSDRPLLWLNLFFLMTISFLPFSTAVIGTHPQSTTGVILYGLNLIASGSFLLAHWKYATRGHRLVDHQIDPALVRRASGRILVGLAAYVAAIGFGFVDPRISVGIYSLVPLFYLLPGRIDLHWLRAN